MAPRMLDATGLRADWLNAWLAAIGVTIAIDGVRLSWSDDAVPHARFSGICDDMATIVYEQLPTLDDLAALPIARYLDGRTELPRAVSLATYRDRAEAERSAVEPSLALCVTDLIGPRGPGGSEDNLPHSAFDVPMPKGITLWQRVVACREAITGPEMVSASFRGPAPRVRTNGLGFDITRIPSRSDGGDNQVDPVVELLAFIGITFFPTRGNGRSGTTRGWRAAPSRHGAFRWGTWHQPRDRWSIDAWLDRFHADRQPDLHSVYQSVPYQPLSASDTTRGYASEPVA